VLWLVIQTILLALQFSYLTETDRYSSQERVLEASSALSWSFGISQPLLSIRLSTYSPELTGKNLKGLGSSHFARHYSGTRYLLSSPQPTKMFQFGWFPFDYPMYSGNDARDMTRGGFPHSDISGSAPVDGSPKLFAVFHVLRRYLVSRHPLCALE
jgi:hypothetical protein